MDVAKLPEAGVDCLRCETPMKDAGELLLHEGKRWGFLGELGELMVNRTEFTMYVCPKCGKAELFV